MRLFLLGLAALLIAAAPVHAETDKATRLYHAVAAQDVDAARALIARGADVNVEKRPWHLTPLLLAAERDPELARLLIDAGADINAADREHQTVLMKAVHTGNTEVVRMLVAREGLDLEARAGLQANTALTYAVMWGRPDIVKLLIDAGADVNVVRVNGTTPMSLARHMLELAHAMPGEGGKQPLDLMSAADRPQHASAGMYHHKVAATRVPQVQSGHVKGKDAAQTVRYNGATGGTAHRDHGHDDGHHHGHGHAHKHGHDHAHEHAAHGHRHGHATPPPDADLSHKGHDAHGHRLRSRADAIREHGLVLSLLEAAGARLDGEGEAPAHHHHH